MGGNPEQRKGSLQDAMTEAQNFIKNLQKSKQMINSIGASTNTSDPMMGYQH